LYPLLAPYLPLQLLHLYLVQLEERLQLVQLAQGSLVHLLWNGLQP